MIAVNLIPASRRIARRRRGRVRAWALFNGAWILVLIGAAAYVNFAIAQPADDTLPEAARLAKERLRVAQDRDKRSLQAVRLAQASLDTARLSSDRPDWSLLLQLIEDRRGEDVLVESVEVSGGMVVEETPAPTRPAKPLAAKAPPTPKKERYDVRLSGIADSPAAATALVLRLEETGLFSQIQLGETQPHDLEGIPKTRFRIDCQLRQKESARPQGERPPESAPKGRRPFSSLKTQTEIKGDQ